MKTRYWMVLTGAVALVLVASGVVLAQGNAEGNDPAGPVKALVFEQLPLPKEPAAKGAEITQPAQRDRFLAALPTAVAASVRGALGKAPGGNRLFGFVLSGCRDTGANLQIGKDQLKPVLTGGEGVNCLVAEYYVAVFSVPADQVPPTAKIAE